MKVKRKVNLSDACFYVFWFFLQIGKGMGYTAGQDEYTTLLMCGFPFLVARFLLIKWDLKSLIKCILLILLGIRIAFRSGTTTYLLSIVCILSVRNIEIKKPLKMVLAIRGPLYIIRTTLAIQGFLDMEMIYRYEQGMVTATRYALGYGHPNTTQYELFMLISVFFYLYKERIRIYHFLLAFAYNWFMFGYTDSKTSYYLCVLFLLAVFVCTRKDDRIIRKIAHSVVTKSWIIGVLITLFGCVFYLYVPAFRELGTFASRFQTALGIIQTTPLSLLGNSGIDTDLGYVHILYDGGAILAVLFFVGVNRMLKLSFVEKDIVLLLIFASFSIFNIMESYTYSVLSNCFLLYLSHVIYSKKSGISARLLY